MLPLILRKSGSDMAQTMFMESLLQARPALGSCLQYMELVTRYKKLKFKKCLGSISREQSILQVLYFQPARAALGIAFLLANFCP